MRKLASSLAILALALGLSACGDDDPAGETDDQSQSESGTNTIKVVETDYSFQVSGTATAGTLTIEVENAGAELHEVAMGKLVEGKTIEDVAAAFEVESEEGNPLDGIVERGTALGDLGNLQTPGASLSLTGDGIEAGEYALICFIPNAEGVSHAKLGMLTSLTVEDGEAGPGPEASTTYTANDEKIDGPTELPAGKTTIQVVNDSSVNREISGFKLREGETVEAAAKWLAEAQEAQGPPDFSTSPFEMFFFAFDSERDRKVTLDLTPGTWALSAPDPEKPFEGPPAEDPYAKVITVK